MYTAKTPEKRLDEIIAEMSQIRDMRIGSLSQQTQKTKLASGEIKENGPYTILTYKGVRQDSNRANLPRMCRYCFPAAFKPPALHAACQRLREAL